ncbi:hypothetical protein E6P09_04265 [Haloferax mediterranei ATCC 33500]|uniref:Uncharacterized protein n=1 Tax=Haloferax mediterranei (strain ATCC 33500 / DSM 1411 / JCM 8866 / NBRC 14739 / NCIMB 2177 / R-4) TaxID=523841 RepID=I3R163_HALMT|nr:hypothetical protein [Haloferax mediterranei]AFK17973.1 hypothetical protein HFX_0232 [Haloferax mediterranei ATCC 33500]AHZ22606.1 hypothetical protein BM92_08100 [Haloferax mediterranei ATCC 33500]EMA02750.1 hypothetical protein C439_09215 [Haloferax mediterranei ATCC 33500]MDX5988065.1 hypothetical protein [Haloferax mediterranei ATCC 33500]QCQ74524.1 hypothetical protein E6P09_04265 [Haloferax mediterranei ATCC 33500]
MGLSDIAAELETTTTEQRPRYVPTVDDTGVSLRERFDAHADALPCAPATAERVVEAHGSGRSLGECAREAGVAPVTAAKVLHRCGEAGVTPLAPEARRIVRDWIDGHISRADALALTKAEPSEFALATYVETHDPIDPLVEAVEGALTDRTDAAVAKRDSLAETMSSVTDMQF